MMQEITCPKCQSTAYKRNGYTRHGKQNHRCLSCGRQFSTEIDRFEFSLQKEHHAALIMDEEVALGQLCLDA